MLTGLNQGMESDLQPVFYDSTAIANKSLTWHSKFELNWSYFIQSRFMWKQTRRPCESKPRRQLSLKGFITKRFWRKVLKNFKNLSMKNSFLNLFSVKIICKCTYVWCKSSQNILHIFSCFLEYSTNPPENTSKKLFSKTCLE